MFLEPCGSRSLTWSTAGYWMEMIEDLNPVPMRLDVLALGASDAGVNLRVLTRTVRCHVGVSPRFEIVVRA